jgi:hypothetical protein
VCADSGTDVVTDEARLRLSGHPVPDLSPFVPRIPPEQIQRERLPQRSVKIQELSGGGVHFQGENFRERRQGEWSVVFQPEVIEM